MKIIENKSFDEERALYGSQGVKAISCRFDGPADGESAFKESADIFTENCYFNLRYPFWHGRNVKILGCEMTELCRAALWYTDDVKIKNTRMHGIKALRECADVTVENCDIISPEFGWFTSGINMKNTTVAGEYFMLRSEGLVFENVTLNGKYSLQYIENSTFEGCNFNTKDAFWHAKNVVVKNSYIKGEYLGWYSENVTFENCVIEGTQPLCYCKGLRLINCEMHGCDLSFEKSEVYADVTSFVDSIKNPLSGKITVGALGELILDDKNALCEVETKNDKS
ncbi:MAG: DUF3737 family protein [Clostridia bacterium]|nr:DUF3737 family protein [Clostridia bacterium]